MKFEYTPQLFQSRPAVQWCADHLTVELFNSELSDTEMDDLARQWLVMRDMLLDVQPRIDVSETVATNPGLWRAVRSITYAVALEVCDATMRFPRLNSSHEAYAVILEELDEVWEHVKANKGGTKVTDGWPEMRKELIQVAAMAVRAVLDLEPGE